jgi:hypothetical protein
MSRWLFLGPVLALFVVGACAADDGNNEVEPILTQGPEVTVADPDGVKCGAVGAIPPTVIHAVGEPVTLVARSALVTSSCRCRNTTTADWGCSSKKHCTSEYDNGGINPFDCVLVSSSSTAAEGTTATVDRADCAVVVAVDAADAAVANVTVRCAREGIANVLVVSHTAGARSVVSLEFKRSVECPVAESDAGLGFGDGDSGDAGDGADAGGGGDAETDGGDGEAG